MQLQPPTATHLRIRSIHDAHKLFHAVYMRMLPMVVRRLDAEERKMIKSGDVHVWEERGPGTEATGLGIERWTDGRLWGPSRVRDCFLFYHEKDREPDDFHAGSKWSRMLSGGVVVFRRRSEGPHYDESGAPSSQPQSSPGSPPGLAVLDITENPESYVGGHPPDGYSEPRERLVKQTYSVLVRLPDQIGEEGNTAVRKWHMTAYFSSSTKSQQALRTVDEIPAIASLQVPDNMYEPARAGRGVTGTTGRLRSTSASASTKSVLVPPLPASMVKSYIHYDDSAYSPVGATSAHHHHHRERPPAHASTYPRYTPYQHRSTPASPTVEYDEYPFSVPSQKGHEASVPTASVSTALPPLQFGSSAVGGGRLRPLSTISTSARSCSRSRSSSTSTTSTSISSTMSPPTPSHFPPLSPSHLTLSPLPLTPKMDSSVDTLSLVPLSFLENVRHNLQQPLAWSSPSARRAVDDEVVRNLEFRP